MAAVSRVSLPLTPDLSRLTMSLICYMPATVWPASSAKLTAASRPCTKAVQSSTQLWTDGLVGRSLKIRHFPVSTAMNRVG